MRIIAGEFRGRTILPPASDTTRPITDRVKQSLFDILTPYLTEAVVYDCFAGTGSMGLESISRGAKLATFFEIDRSALGLLKKNIASLKVESQARIVSTDLFKWFAAQAPNPPADLIFLDPPYRFLREKPTELQTLAEHMKGHLAPGGIVLFRHDAADELNLAALNVFDRREYGGMTIELLTAKNEGSLPPYEPHTK